MLLWHDLFGLYHGRSPKFARRYGEAGALFAEGLKHFADDVRARRFPTEEHMYDVPEAERAAIADVVEQFMEGARQYE